MKTPNSVGQLILLAFSLARASDCPRGCVCSFEQVTCSGLTSFPTSFPVDTVSINVTHMNADEIPVDCLDNMEFIKNVFIQSSTILRVRSGSFNGHDFMGVIRFDDVHIKTIESFAFNNIVELGTLAVYNSSIENIEMFAFSNMYAVNAIEFNNCNITSIATNAFYNMNEMIKIKFDDNNIKTLEPNSISGVTKINELFISYNAIESLGCGNIEKLLNEAHTGVMSMNTVTCSCDLLWLQKSESLKPYLDSNWCKEESGKLLAWGDIAKAFMACSETDITSTHCVDLPESNKKSDFNTDYPHQKETATSRLHTTGTSIDEMTSQTTNSFTSNAWDVLDNVKRTTKMTRKDDDLQKDKQTPKRKVNHTDNYSMAARGTIVLPNDSFDMFGIDGNKSRKNEDETGHEQDEIIVQNGVVKKPSNIGFDEQKNESFNTDSFAYADQSMKTDKNYSNSKGTETREKVELEITEDNHLRQISMTSAVEGVPSNTYVFIIVYAIVVIL
ncbi:uncharacterized protein LOC127855964 [Dreissena polymorpha]|uniref:Uncharacterized protein n=1 Tax=Dreissena polymorpha TaxID=45954 RepID=A0A9D4CB25_DREPO|nr:uncharacterized protein LOC127855964 [Dreissena polymorpha]KAH3720818.1 hypothetical protein DPMN_063723 [Dreissena polymorpha]